MCKTKESIPDEAFTLSDDGTNCLFGIISLKSSKKTNLYQVQFGYTGIPKMDFSSDVLLHLVDLYNEKMNSKKITTPTSTITSNSKITPISTQSVTSNDRNMPSLLDEVASDEEGIAPDSDDEIEDLIGDDVKDEENIQSTDLLDMYEDSKNLFQAESIDGIKWEFGHHVDKPTNAGQHGKTTLRSGFGKSFFTSPLASLLRFLPIGIWLDIVKESNRYASQTRISSKQTVSGVPWKQDITIKELMTFFGIMLHMCIRPMPGHPYTDAWKDRQWQPFTQHMRLGRFKQIRSVLHISDNLDSKSKTDTLWKFRRLLNCIRMTLSRYVNVGGNMALDETSISSRSKYGRNFIFYNATKPTGKYHFRFYMLCCSSTHMLLNIKMHTQDNNDDCIEKDNYVINNILDDKNGDYDSDNVYRHNDDEWLIVEQQKISKLVLDMLTPYHGTNRIVNMDRYYGSCISVMNLKSKGLFSRATTKETVKHFPSSIVFQKNECNSFGRGAYRFGSESTYGMVAFSWVDGNPVNMITTADGSNIDSVTRRIGKKKFNIQSPMAIQQYNKNMDAVDRWDQMLAKFSLHKRHKFKKYYRNIMMVIIDFAILQADVHYHLAHPNKKVGTSYRDNFYEHLANEMIHSDWNKMANEFTQTKPNSTAICQDSILNQLGIPISEIQDIVTGECNMISNQQIANECTPISTSEVSNSKDGRSCQICKFEGRGRKVSNVIFCKKHKIRCCSNVPKDISSSGIFKSGVTRYSCNDWSWMCPNKEWTCWEKFHDYYLPSGLFTKPNPRSKPYSSVQIVKSHDLYKRQQICIGQLKGIDELSTQTNMSSFISPKAETPVIIRGRRTLEEELRSNNSKDNYSQILKEESDIKLNREINKDIDSLKRRIMLDNEDGKEIKIVPI